MVILAKIGEVLRLDRWTVRDAAAAAHLSVVLATTFAFGIGSQLSPTLRRYNYTFWSIVFLCAAIVLTASCSTLRKVPRGPPTRAGSDDAPWIALCCILGLTLYLVLPTGTAIAAVILLFLTTAGLRYWGNDHRVVFTIPLATLIGLMFYFVRRMNLLPDDPGMDLLPITRAVIHNAALGINPYQADYSDITAGPFFYLPMEWLTYMPFEMAGINLRWVNYCCWLTVIALFECNVRNSYDRNLGRTMFYPVMASYPVFQAMDTQVPPLWLGMACFMATLLTGRILLASSILGYLLAASQVMLAVGGLTGAFFLRILPPYRYLAALVISVSIALLVIGPFIWISPDYLATVFVTRPRIANMAWELSENAFYSVGFNNILYHLHLEMLRPVLQVVVLLIGAIALMIRPPPNTAGFLYAAGLVFLCAIALNGQILRYYYYPPLLMIAWGGAFAFQPGPTAISRK